MKQTICMSTVKAPLTPTMPRDWHAFPLNCLTILTGIGRKETSIGLTHWEVSPASVGSACTESRVSWRWHKHTICQFPGLFMAWTHTTKTTVPDWHFGESRFLVCNRWELVESHQPRKGWCFGSQVCRHKIRELEACISFQEPRI